MQTLEDQHREAFPLSDADYASLRAQLHDRILTLYEGEIAAQAAMADAIE